jgi:hypothetical protein
MRRVQSMAGHLSRMRAGSGRAFAKSEGHREAALRLRIGKTNQLIE